MDNSMVKRGIGAVVLAIIAALLLGWLLKDKSQERQELVDIKMPNASEMNIPSLTDAVNKVGDSASNIVEGTKEKVAEASSSVVAAASGTVNTVKNAVTDTSSDASKATTENGDSNSKPGFSIRPPQQNETKEIVDNVEEKGENVAKDAKEKSVEVTAPTNNTDDTVVASTKKEASFTPQIVEKKKAPKKKVVAKKPTTTNTPAPSGASGKYAIQLLATSSETRAKKLADTMTSEGYKSFITQTHRDGKLLYRVRVGGYAERNIAIKAQDGMKKRYQKNFFVQNSLVISK